MLGCEYLYSLGPFADDGDWMAEHLNVHPRTTMVENRFFRLGGQTILEVFHYDAPDRHDTVPRNSDVGGHHVAFYVDDLDAAVAELRRAGVTVCAEPTASRSHNEGQRWIYFLAPVGHAVRAGVLSGRSRVRAGAVGDVTADAAVAPAASRRVADHLRAEILGGGIGPGERVRQEEIAQRLGASRLPVREALRMLEAEGLVEHEANKGARVPRLGRHEVDVIYRMREQLEPLALAESLPRADRRARSSGWPSCRTRSRPVSTSDGSCSWTGSSISARTGVVGSSS